MSTRRKNNLYNFRVESEEKLNDYKQRSKTLKSNKQINASEIYEDGLLVNEGKDEEQTILNKKNMKKAIRNNALEVVISNNAQIRAHNLRLKDLNKSRYKHLDPDDGTIKLFDEDGNRIV